MERQTPIYGASPYYGSHNPYHSYQHVGYYPYHHHHYYPYQHVGYYPYHHHHHHHGYPSSY
ncbi:hypothetical protein IGI01_25970 [Bacillus thuringiensis]|nr:hypothetical protein [Bacillus thuringiensis]